MTIERIKEIQLTTPYPESVSVQQALLQVWNEVAQEKSQLEAQTVGWCAKGGKNMRVLIACERYGLVRDAFAIAGHDAWSCDIMDSVLPGKHIKDDVRKVLNDGWNIMIAFPPCTHLAVSGARWFKYKIQEQKDALDFVKLLMNAPIEKIAIENPVGIISSRIRKPDQIIQPYMFGDSYSKTTCLWLKNLPKLLATEIVSKGEFVIHGGKRLPKWYSNRERDRDKTSSGIALAMAKQWG